MYFMVLSFRHFENVVHLNNARKRGELGHRLHGLTRIIFICVIRVYLRLLNQFAELTVGDQLNLIVLKDFAEGSAGEEFEIALAPGGAPVGMI
jgi:hypothetical protein